MHLGLDCGERYFKAIIINSDSGEILYETSVVYDEDFPYRHTENGQLRGARDGERFVDPQMWIESIDTLMERLVELGANLSQVTTISGVAEPATIFLRENWQKTLAQLNPSLPLNDQLRQCYATRVSPTSKDSSATDSAEIIRSKFSRTTQISQIIGSKLDSSKGASQIHQLHTTSSVTWEITASIHVTSSFIQSILIGKAAPIELSDTAQLGLFDLKEGDWHDEIIGCTAPDLRAKLPQLTKSNVSSGKISDYFIFKYGFSEKVDCFPWMSRDAAIALGHGVFQPSTSLLCLGNSYDYINYVKKLPAEIPSHACVSIHPMGGFLTKFTLYNGLRAFKQTIKNLNLDRDKLESLLDSLPSSRNLPTLPFIMEESENIPKSNQSGASLLSLTSGQILHLQLFNQWADEHSTELTITGEGSALTSLRLLCANIFQVPTYHLPEDHIELLGTMIPYLISEHQSASSILKKLIRTSRVPLTKPEPFMASFYTNQLQEYFHLLTKHINN